jgi:hypothetical protein
VEKFVTIFITKLEKLNKSIILFTFQCSIFPQNQNSIPQIHGPIDENYDFSGFGDEADNNDEH